MPRHIVNLNGSDWRLGRSPTIAPLAPASWQERAQVDEWLPARVPGNVRADLIRAGHLPDPAVAMAAEESQWVDGFCWWLEREFPHPGVVGDRAHLVLRGLDYIGDLFLNGQYLGRHEGMFSPQVHDVTDLIVSENHLAVRILGSHWLPQDRSNIRDRVLSQVEAKLGSMPGRFPHRRDTLKCQMSFGWDFAPPLRTMGIWDDVYLVTTTDLYIEDACVRQQVSSDAVGLTIRVQVHAKQGHRVRLRLVLEGVDTETKPVHVEQPVELAPGRSSHTLQVKVTQPSLWWPWDHGYPHLYHLAVEAVDGDQLLDRCTQTIGLRSVTMEDWTLLVNGRPIYARGANWVPADILPGRVKAADYTTLLTLARQANMNMLRVWGGGLREKRPFYDLCDRLGILVWQEFPFACAYLTRYPRCQDYLSLVQAEAEAIIRDLRNRPSLAIWCGGNEFSPERNAPLVATLRRAVVSEDPTRPFLPASPHKGDSHNWQVWHSFHPPSEYRRDKGRFASEFGLQAPPKAGMIQRFIPHKDLWPPGPSWTYHGAGLKKLERYARPFLAEREPSLEGFVRASQRAQAHGLQIAIEHYRRRRADGCGGLLVWQLNEPWPAVSWSLVDYYRQPKPSYSTVQRLLSPVLISIEFPQKDYQPGEWLCGSVWIISDMSETLSGCQLEVALWDGAGQLADSIEQSVDIPSASARVVNNLKWKLPQAGGWRLTCSLAQDENLLATNWYDLTAHDDIQPSMRQRLRARLTSLVLAR